jgi:hypothetical protein
MIQFVLERFQSKDLLIGMCRIGLSKGISKYQQLKKKSAATALNTVLASATRQQAIAKTPAK